MFGQLKRLGTETLIYGLSTIIGRFLTFMLTPVYTNYLNPVEFDFVIYTYSIIAFVNILYSFGLESSYFRFFKSGTPADSQKVFTHSWVAIQLISIVGTLFIFVNSETFGNYVASGDLDSPGFLIRTAVFIPFFDAMILIPFAYLRMTNKAMKFALTKFALIVIAVALNFKFVVFDGLGASGVFYAQLTSSIIGFFIFIPLIFNNIALKFDIKLFIQMLKFGLPTLPANFSAIILQVADRPIIKMLNDSPEFLTTYQTNHRLGIPMMLFVTIFEYAWKPFYLSTYSEENAKEMYSRIFTYFTLISAFIFLFVSFFLEYIVAMPGIGGKLINPMYWNGLGIVPIILGAYYFNGAFTNFNAGILIEKKTQYLPIAIGAAAIVNIILNFTLIPSFNLYGAAMSQFGGYLISAIIIYFYSQKYYKISYEWSRVTIIIIITLAIYFIFSHLFDFKNDLYNVIIKSTGLFIYFIVLYFLNFLKKDEIDMLKRLLKRNAK